MLAARLARAPSLLGRRAASSMVHARVVSVVSGSDPMAARSCWREASSSSSSPLLAAGGAAAAAAAVAGVAAWSAVSLCDDGESGAEVAMNLDEGYAPRVSNPSAVIRKRAGPAPRPGEPVYTADQVSEHDDPDGPQGMWVTYRDGVYDVTDFVKIHPGGQQFIRMAAGGSVNALWSHWHYHHVSLKVGEYLEQYRVGRLADWDPAEDDDTLGIDPFELDPARPAAQIGLFDRPFNSETRPDALKASYLTPPTSVYVRNHAPVPQLEAASHAVSFAAVAGAGALGGAGGDQLGRMTLAELEAKYGTKTVTSIIQCSGNRARENIAAHGPNGFSGVNFENMNCGMVGNVQWTGIPLAKVLGELYPGGLEALQAKAKANRHAHVEFFGADEYYASVPLAHVVDPSNDVLLATKMNGEPLPPDHGFPVRVLLPGIAGARNVKWTNRIVVRDDEGDSPWNNYYYKNKSLPKDDETGEYPSCQQLPVNSLVLSAEVKKKNEEDEEEEEEGGGAAAATIDVSGIAYSGGLGANIESVEVSADKGRTWHTVTLDRGEVLADDSSKHWHWLRWTATVPAPMATAAAAAATAAAAGDEDGSSAGGKSAAGGGKRVSPDGLWVKRAPGMRPVRTDGEDYEAQEEEEEEEEEREEQEEQEEEQAAEEEAAAPGVGGGGGDDSKLEVWCRAMTEDGVIQPHVPPQRGGYFFNGYHKLAVEG